MSYKTIFILFVLYLTVNTGSQLANTCIPKFQEYVEKLLNTSSTTEKPILAVTGNATCLSPTTGVAPQTFTAALQYFAAAQCLLQTDYPPDADVCNDEAFDIIIVGAGTAGCVLANRLSENKSLSILVLDAGEDPPVEAEVPALDKAMFQSKYDWQYFTTNDGRSNQAQINGSIAWPRGKMLGGSSNINAMLYVKGSTYDYQRWYDDGNTDWHPETVEKYFKKAENYQYQALLKNAAVRNEYGHKGNLIINRCNSTYRPLTEDVLDALDENGMKRVEDFNVANVMGSSISPVTAANGIRQSSVTAYLNPVKNRPNLKVLKNTLCTKILIDKTTKKAYGVQVKRNGKTMIFCAKHEVIISAGAINSPQLLMLSGIGPKDHLESKNISTLVDLPVGQNLQDHVIVSVTIYGDGPTQVDEATRNFDAIKYLYNRTGYLAQISFADILTFYSSSEDIHYPEFQSHLTIFWKNFSNTRIAYSNRFRYNATVADNVVELNKKHILYDFLFNLLHPYSRGNVSLNTSNPEDHPYIYPNYFKDPRDLETAATGLRMLSRIVNTRYFRSINAFLGRMTWPPCDKYELDSIDYWKCVCLNMARSCYHPVGTCKMGTDPKTSVVDSKLRVHGTKNLRVIDASIMPTITSGNTYAPTIMIGERGADLVKERYL